MDLHWGLATSLLPRIFLPFLWLRPRAGAAAPGGAFHLKRAQDPTVPPLVRPPPGPQGAAGPSRPSRPSGLAPHGLIENAHDVQGAAASTVSDLMPAGKAVRGDPRPCGGVAHPRQQRKLAHGE